MSGDDRMARRLDQVDRKSQVSVSRAMRSRDVSRPDPADIATALEAFENRASGQDPGSQVPRSQSPGAKGGNSPSSS